MPEHSDTAHDFISRVPDSGGDHDSHGYPDECLDFVLFSDSIAALLTDGDWMIQPFTQKRQAIVIDFASRDETEAEASLAHGWNGAFEFPMGVANTVYSRTETNAQNARISRHLCLIATGFTMRDFFWNVTEKLLDEHSCKEKDCRICGHRFKRDLGLTLTIFADGLGFETINLFSKWEPSLKLRRALKEEHITIAWRPLRDIPATDLEANRHYSIWDGTFEQGNDFLRRYWSPAWKLREMKDLVYGDTPGSLVFMTRARAKDLAGMHRAKDKAKNWADFKRLAPPSIVSEVEQMMGDDEPDDDDPVELPGYEDGDWPFPQQEQMELLPDDVIQLGSVIMTTFNGERLDFSAKREAEIVAKLTLHGFQVDRDDELVTAACNG